MNAPFLPGRGFSDPVMGSQIVFRAIMQALSRPGERVEIDALGIAGPAGLPAPALAILVTLCDYETPVWLDAELRAGPLRQWLAFHCGAPVTERPEDAAFALLRCGVENPDLAEFAQGDERYPDRSTTLLVLCEAISGGENVTLSGPGILREEHIAPRGLSRAFFDKLRVNHALFPRGVDVLLQGENALIGLPRTTRVLTGKN